MMVQKAQQRGPHEIDGCFLSNCFHVPYRDHEVISMFEFILAGLATFETAHDILDLSL
jgi:hypothetical protein